MPDANELLRIQHEVTSERDPERRLAAIEQERHRTVVDKFHCHVRAKDPRRDLDALGTTEVAEKRVPSLT